LILSFLLKVKKKEKEIKINFYAIFMLNGDIIETLRVVRIGGVQIGKGVRLGSEVTFGGINLFNHIGCDFRAEEQDGILIITGIFNQ